MLGLEKNGVWLDLAPGTSAQLERLSPFFSKDSLAEEHSFPITFPYTPKNVQFLGLANHYYTRRLKLRIPDVGMYDNNNFSYSGDLIITAVNIDINDIRKSTITGHFATGVSSFFQLVKNKKLRELELGGERQFAWTNNDPASPNKGFWQHIHDTLAGTMEYSFAPIRNQMWSGNTDEGSMDWMNRLDNTGRIDYENNFNTLAPQVSLKYVLEKIFTEHGWDFDYSLMDDEQWQTLFMPSFFAVTWQKIIQLADPPYFMYSPLANINLNLQNHVPPEDHITNFIIDLANRYNWGFHFDAGRKVCYMAPLKNLANGAKKDWTPYMGAKVPSDFSEDPKIFAFKNEIDPSDALSSAPDFSKIPLPVPVFSYDELPPPAEDLFNQVYYCWKENQYYQCGYDEAENTYFWGLLANGIYNYEPSGSNEEISTAMSTMPVYKTLYRTNGISDYYGYFPLCEQEGNWVGKAGAFVPWKTRLLFHRGLVWEAGPEGFKGQIQYPYLTSTCFTITQEEPDLEWSNVWKHEFEGEDKGIIEYWYKGSLEYLKQSEVSTFTLMLPRQELVNFAWSDIILLRNIMYIVQKFTEVIPYRGTVQAELRRIG